MGDRLARARTATLLGAVLTSLSSGTNYVFSAYAPQMGARLHITNTQLNIIGLSGNMGVYTSGVVLGRIADKHGPRLLLVLASVFLFAGYIGLRGYFDAGPSSEDVLPLFSLIVMSALSFMTGAGGSSGLIAAMNSTAKSFPEHLRATTVGFVLSGFGLSAFFFSALARWFFPDNTSSFLLFLSLGTSLPIIIGFLTIRPVPHSERPDAGPGGLTLHSGDDFRDSTSRLLDYDANNTVAGERGLNSYARESGGHEDADISAEAHDGRVTDIHPDVLLAETDSQTRSRSIAISPSRGDSGRRASSSQKTVSKTRSLPLPEPVDTHGWRMLTGWEFWVLFCILSIQSGTGLMYINNVGTIAQALLAKGNPDYDRIKAVHLQTAQVSLISLANCGSRIAFGAGADFLKSRYAIHRSYLMSLVSILLMVSQIVGALVEDPNHLWLASLLLGSGYGGIFGLLPTVTMEWFGLAHFSENWGFVTLAPLLGGNIFSVLFGWNVDAHVPRSTDLTSGPRAPASGLAGQCFEGRVCYASTLLITTLACVLALFLSVVAAWRDRRKANLTGKYEGLPQNPPPGEVLWESEADE
ncbi:major facilitator superfamily domain-containing protein [Gautieria morchelliformis]|nr:major facilitator superfamily domain-containing protein [Gautieria morchelliformis]